MLIFVLVTWSLEDIARGAVVVVRGVSLLLRCCIIVVVVEVEVCSLPLFGGGDPTPSESGDMSRDDPERLQKMEDCMIEEDNVMLFRISLPPPGTPNNNHEEKII